jgi:hypothetical protein
MTLSTGKKIGITKADDPLFKRMAENTDESAAAALLTQLCRESPELRHWLWADFGRHARVRKKFAGIVKKPASPAVASFADLAGAKGPLRKERTLGKRSSTRLYGGLTWNEVMSLIHRHQAGGVDLGTFLLVQAWQEAGKASPLLMWAGMEFLHLALLSGHQELIRHLWRSLVILQRSESKAKRRAALGYTDWWKLHVLFYILKHPKTSYGTPELLAHLTALGLRTPAQNLRRFCTRHGIRTGL